MASHDLEKTSSAASSETAFNHETAPKSFGVQKAEGAARTMSPRYIFMIFAFIALAAYIVSLDQYTAFAYETEALSTAFGQHSLIATINTIEGIMQAVSQPPFAKLCDIIGRWESYGVSVFLYTLGYIIVATSQNVGTYAGGTIIYVLGITGFWLINQVIIADNSSTRSRLFWSIFPSIPGTINVWLSGNIAAAIIPGPGWRFGFAMFTFLVPICLAPVILALAWAQRKARKLGYLDSVVAPWKHGSAKVVARDVFWQTDFVGLLLLVAGLSLLLIPMTIARTAARGWQSPLVPGMMVPGGVTLAAFGVWEAKFARFPIFPVYLLHSRTIIFGFMINLCNPMAGSVQGNYLYSWYLVGANQSVLSATRLNSLAVFTATLTAAATGLAVMRVRRLKPFIFAGALIQILALGLMTRFRGRENSIGELAILQVLKGIGGGMINFPTQAAAQTACKHEHVAVITAAFLAVFYIGRAVGSAIGGAIWSAQLPGRLLTAVGDPALATTIYRNPIGWIRENGFDNPQREAVAIAYSDSQRLIFITSIAVACLVVIFAACLDNLELGDKLTLDEIEGEGKAVLPGAGGRDAPKVIDAPAGEDEKKV